MTLRPKPEYIEELARWVRPNICIWKDKYYFGTEDEQLEGPYDSIELAEVALSNYVAELQHGSEHGN